jgi:hypothetical protein
MADRLRKFTETVQIKVDDLDSIYWIPDAPAALRLSGNPEIVDIVNAFIEFHSQDSDVIKATPEGPYLPGTNNSLYTVVWAISTLFREQNIKFYGEVPTLKELGLDYASNFDENGKPIIR